MSTSVPQEFPDLDVMWHVEEPSNLKCHACLNPLGTSPLMRTFCLRQSHHLKASEGIRTSPNKSEDIILYDRHLECALDSQMHYVAVSHVWHPTISKCQARGRHSPQGDDIRRLAFDAVIEIGQNVSKSLDKGCEIWHDYISVP